MYTIEITYTTGDSINGPSQERSCINFCSDDFKEITTVLSYIEQHYDFLQRLEKLTNSYFLKNRKTEQQVFNMYKNQPWFCEESPLTSIKYKDREISLSFCYGYFEVIQSAKVVFESSEDLPPTEIEFY